MRIVRYLWTTVTEPRVVTLLTVISYVVYGLVGVVYIFSPSTLAFPILPSEWIPLAAVVFLISGGAVGSLACWRGVWSIEAAAAVSCTAGVLLAGLDTISRLTRDHDASPYLTALVAGMTLVAALAGSARLAFVWSRQDVPRGGVVYPEDEARQTYAEIVRESQMTGNTE